MKPADLRRAPGGIKPALTRDRPPGEERSRVIFADTLFQQGCTSKNP